jgi:hypothetical protein
LIAIDVLAIATAAGIPQIGSRHFIDSIKFVFRLRDASRNPAKGVKREWLH